MNGYWISNCIYRGPNLSFTLKIINTACILIVCFRDDISYLQAFRLTTNSNEASMFSYMYQREWAYQKSLWKINGNLASAQCIDYYAQLNLLAKALAAF